MSLAMSASKVPDCERKSVKLTDNGILESPRQPSYEFPHQFFDIDLRKLLVQVTGEADTADLSKVKIKVITKRAGLHRLADYTPRLRVLVLDDSCVDSLRDLGSSLKNLETLSVVRCNLRSLDGLWGFRRLSNLIARYNFIEDPSPCSGVRKLAKLDLYHNEIEDPYSFAFLRNCKYLKSLDVAENRFDDYQHILTMLIPQIRILDGESVNKVDDEAQADSEEESDLTSEDEDLVFCPGDGDDSFGFRPNEETIISPMKTRNVLKGQLCPGNCQLGAGDVEPIASKFHKKCEYGSEEDDAKILAARSLDSSSSSIFLMTREFDDLSMLDLSARNVENYHPSLETTPSKLSSGDAICGNLAASLRSRNSTKNPFTLPTVLVKPSVDPNDDPKNSIKRLSKTSSASESAKSSSR